MVIKEAFANLSQETVEDRATVTTLTDANIHLATQVAAQANIVATKDVAMETMSKLIQKLQGGIKTLKSKQSGHSTKKTNPSGYKKGNWWSGKYCWTHVLYVRKPSPTFLRRQ